MISLVLIFCLLAVKEFLGIVFNYIHFHIYVVRNILYAQDPLEKKPPEGREAAAPSNIKEIQEIQGGQEAPHDGDAFNPKDA